MATIKVWDTVELLEAILLSLPTKDILFSQRVCKSFCDVIAGSLHLKRALYLVPAQAEDMNATLHGRPNFGTTTIATHHGPLSTREQDFPEGSSLILFNPLLVSNLPGPRYYDTPGTIRCFPFMATGARLSCDRMYLTQPPLDVRTTHFIAQWSRIGVGYPYGIVGTTFGHLRTQARHELECMEGILRQKLEKWYGTLIWEFDLPK